MTEKRNGTIRRILYVLVGMTMLTVPAAAGGGRQTGSTGAVTSIDVLAMVGNGVANVEKSGWYVDWLRDNLGVELRFRELGGQQNASQIFMNHLASRQMTDILTAGEPVTIRQAADAGLLINLDDYKDKLPALYNNPLYANAIAFSRKNLSANGDALYGINAEIGKSNNINYVPVIRYDLYERLGSPRLASMDDLIPLLKRMMELEPVTETGHKTYGFALFPEWDGNEMNFSRYFTAIWGGDYWPQTMVETSGIGSTGTIISRLDDNSLTKKALKWFFKANQAGILDPDSATQSWPTTSEKYTDGALFFSIWEWATGGYNILDRVGAANPKGFAPILSDDMRIIIEPDNVVGTSTRFMAIGANSNQAKVDAALRYLNHYYSVEGQELLYNLPEGVIWEKGSDGLARIKASAWQYLDNDTGIPELGDSKAGDAAGLINFRTINSAEISPITGRVMERGNWPEVIQHNNASNKIFQKWSAANNGVNSFYDLVTSTGRSVKADFAYTFVPAAPEDIQALTVQIGDVLKTNSWKMVYAANETEFETLWKEIQTKADTLGMQRILTWAQTEWAKAQTEAAKYR